MLIKKMIAAQYAIYIAQLKKEIEFFKVPISIESIKKLIKDKIKEIESNLLDSLLSLGLGLLAAESFINFIKQTPEHRQIIKEIDNSYNESEVNELLLKCSISKESKDKEIENTQTMIYDIASSNNLLEDGVFALSSLLSMGSLALDLYNNYKAELALLKSSIHSFIILFKDILDKIKTLLKSRYPSKYLLKRISHSIELLIKTEITDFKAGVNDLYNRYTSMMKDMFNNLKTSLSEIQSNITNSFNKVISFIKNIKLYAKTINSLLISLSIACFTYIANSYFIKKLSKKSFKENVSQSLCINDTDDLLINNSIMNNNYKDTTNSNKKINSLEVNNLICKVNNPEYIIPSKPINTVEEFNCDNKYVEPVEEFKESIDTSNDAIIINHLPDIFIISIEVNTNIKAGDILGYVKNIPIYSPVSGYVDKIEYNRIYITNLNDDNGNIQLNIIEEYQNIIKRQSYLRAFLMAFKGPSFYPIYLYGTNKKSKAVGLKRANNKVLEAINNYIKEYYNNIQKISSADNVKNAADSENLSSINDKIKEQDRLLINKINKSISDLYKNSKILKAEKDEYKLFYYYFDLYTKLEADKDNEISKELSVIIKKFYEKRYKIECINKDDLIKLINSVINKIKPFTLLLNTYKIKYLISDVEKTLDGILNKLTISDNERTEYRNKILILFNFYLNNDQKNKDKELHIDELQKESNIIKQFLDNIDIEYKNIEYNIKKIEDKIDAISYIKPYYIENIDNIDYRIYILDEEKKDECDADDTNNMAKSKYSVNTINYWLKYCSIATAIGCINLASWSTGLILPTGPLKLPIIYLPFKVLNTDFGQIVIGLSICGIAITPLIIGVNFSYLLNCITGDPTKPIKAEINEFKKQINNLKSKFKNITLKPLLKNLESNINEDSQKVLAIKNNIRELKITKPEKIKYENKLKYSEDLYNWGVKYSQYKEELAFVYLSLYENKSKHYVLRQFINSDKAPNKLKDTKEVKVIETNNKSIDAALEGLRKLQEAINKLLMPLPITMMEDSINFGPGLKNFMPVNKIDDNMSQGINTSILNSILDKFSLKNEQMMSANINKESNNSVLNTSKFKKTIQTQMSSLIIKDDIPKYENLKPTNVRWLVYLNTKFLLKGGSIYGLPV